MRCARKLGSCRSFLQQSIPQLNGEAERLMRTLVEAARTLCCGGKPPASLWEQAMRYYVYVHNLTPREVLEGKTPWGVFTKRPKQPMPKFYFGELVTCSVDDKQRQTTAAKRVDPLGKINTGV